MATTARRDAAPASELLSPLVRLRGIIHTYVLMDVVLFALLFLTGWFWIGMAVDWGLFAFLGVDVAQHMPAMFRWVVTGFLAALLVALMLVRAVTLLRQELTDTNLALLLEKRYPKLLGDRLITALELSDVDAAARAGYSRDMVEKTIADARERVGQVSVRGVFNWTRLWVKFFLIFGVSLIGLGAGLGVFLLGSEPTIPGGYAAKFTDVAHVWVERNVTFAGTPWPRRAHVELLGFPESGELRVGKANKPAVRARAYKWVVAAPGTRDGWRPLRWADLNGTEIRGTVLTCPAPPIGDLLAANAGLRPANAKADFADTLTVDEVEFALGIDVDTDVETALADGTDTVESILARTEAMPTAVTPTALKETFWRLNALARQPSLSRTFRKLLLPRKVTDENGESQPVNLRFEYASKNPGNPVTFGREASGASVGVVDGLKETVLFDVQFENFATDLRQITLVPPPLFTDIETTDYYPAYLYHKAPNGDIATLRGLKQLFAGNKLTLTGDVSEHQVPFGSEIELTITTDKPLASARLEPLPSSPHLRTQTATADQPTTEGDLTVKTVAREGGDGFSTVTVAFRKRIRPDTISGTPVWEVIRDESITVPTEFKLEITDRDGVTNERLVKFRTTEDAPPEVKLTVDELFKFGTEYWFTPKARIPFAAGSGVTDQSGLSNVVFDFKWQAVESAAVAAAVAELATQASAGSPPAIVAPTPAAAAVSAAAVTAALSLDTGSAQVSAGTFPVPRFKAQYEGLTAETLDGLKRKLTQKFDGNYGVVKSVRFNDPDTGVLDVEAALPTLAAKDDEIQPRYALKLNAVATDSNADRVAPLNDWATRRMAAAGLPARKYEMAAPPKTASETASISILIVSQEDLLVEVSKKEDSLISKIDEALKRAEDAQRKLSEQAGYLANPNADPETLKNAAVRSGDIVQDVTKSRNLCQELLVQYVNLATVLKANRVRDEVLKTYENPLPPGSTLPRGDGYIDRLNYLLRMEPNPGLFQTTGDALDSFQMPLAQVPPVRPADAQMAAARGQVDALAKELRDLQAYAGKNYDINKARAIAQRLLQNQELIKTDLQKRITEIGEIKKGPKLTPPEQVAIKAGETKKLKFKIDWQLYKESTILVTLTKTPKESDLVVPADLVLQEEKNAAEFELEVTAGQKLGITTIEVKPAIGRAVEVRIEVVK